MQKTKWAYPNDNYLDLLFLSQICCVLKSDRPAWHGSRPCLNTAVDRLVPVLLSSLVQSSPQPTKCCGVEHILSLRKTVQRCLSLLLSSRALALERRPRPVKPLFLPKTTSTVCHTSPAWPTKVLTLLYLPSGEKV